MVISRCIVHCTTGHLFQAFNLIVLDNENKINLFRSAQEPYIMLKLKENKTTINKLKWNKTSQNHYQNQKDHSLFWNQSKLVPVKTCTWTGASVVTMIEFQSMISWKGCRFIIIDFRFYNQLYSVWVYYINIIPIILFSNLYWMKWKLLWAGGFLQSQKMCNILPNKNTAKVL